MGSTAGDGVEVADADACELGGGADTAAQERRATVDADTRDGGARPDLCAGGELTSGDGADGCDSPKPSRRVAATPGGLGASVETIGIGNADGEPRGCSNGASERPRCERGDGASGSGPAGEGGEADAKFPSCHVATSAGTGQEPGSAGGGDFAGALAMIARLPLSDAEKAEAVRRLLTGTEFGQ